LLHGGHSSVLARGGHAGHAGWPIGVRNPNFPDRQLATLLLSGQGMSTSGSGVQYFRFGGRRYGHLLDPRTGWPVEGMLSVTVLAPTAAEADALSTAFFVLGVEKARSYCHNRTDVAALLIPHPPPGRRLEPVNLGIPDDVLFITP
ncbi:MAG TPA: FAD:protein FMN transferase, partial [Planctomycetaceae bacterium]|nr:FAD:protein FMN transferase [Planctomycetaceae bacterium]